MKILVQDSSKNFLWRDVIWKSKHFALIEDDRITYRETDVFAIKDDNRNKIVVCSACGCEVPNTKTAIKAHQEMVHKANKCFECRYLKCINPKIISHKYSLNTDGTYTETNKRCVNLVCHKTWNDYEINSAEANHSCKYSACETAQFKAVEDFWTKYPGAFDDMITVDRIIDIGYKDVKKYDYYSIFDIKCRTKMRALVNNQGICFGFQISHNRSYYDVCYSKKYDTAWYSQYGNYSQFSNLCLPESTERSIMNKLRELYT